MVPVPPLFAQPLIVVSSKGGPRAANPAITCLPVLRPSTTQANKVPIPALGPKYARKRAAAPKADKPKRPKAAPPKVAGPEPDKPEAPRAREASPPRPPTPPPLEPKAPKALELEMNLPQTELSNDIFASFQVPPGCQNAESTSPTAAFLLAFPLVSSGAKAALEEATESQAGTPNLLQIGALDMAKPAQSFAGSLTPPNLFDGFAFFNGNKEYSCALEPPPPASAAAKRKGDPKEGKFPEGDLQKFNCPPSFKGGSNAQLWEGDVFGESCGSKAKKRPPTTEGPQNVLPSFDMHFFSMPGAVNSPILPDDFHTTYLPPTTLYSCKTPLYSKAGSEGGFMPPSVAPQGNALTNFNLSTIFPEINKGPGHDGFGDTRAKGFQGPFI
ncbi:hypothetical protein HUJ05_011039 [Dendroctonus ponderosae]|nr:hypothetical protein HUJ05_011039 [Dendroctonus ponderosae]